MPPRVTDCNRLLLFSPLDRTANSQVLDPGQTPTTEKARVAKSGDQPQALSESVSFESKNQALNPDEHIQRNRWGQTPLLPAIEVPFFEPLPVKPWILVEHVLLPHSVELGFLNTLSVPGNSRPNSKSFWLVFVVQHAVLVLWIRDQFSPLAIHNQIQIFERDLSDKIGQRIRHFNDVESA